MALPGQYRAAERLDLPEPNAVQQVATDTALGGAFAGVLVGAAKAIGWGANWASARNQTAIVARPEVEESRTGARSRGCFAAEGRARPGNRTANEETLLHPTGGCRHMIRPCTNWAQRPVLAAMAASMCSSGLVSPAIDQHPRPAL
ncbi:hypothetical protein [Rhodoferax sp.]|uniref:hypothetical protein n=1 Tax=Rhodoferax sp. TaxID=50421 RepID=UPI002ACE18E9|nr:hypothetical protein [Rhodoferax sp.]MDZ7919992.1 hypothetical protein [Rhodoferax sp.]